MNKESNSVSRERHDLTQREKEILKWLTKGKTNKDIAFILTISPRTIEKHLEKIYLKLGVDNRMAAVAVAFLINSHQSGDQV